MNMCSHYHETVNKCMSYSDNSALRSRLNVFYHVSLLLLEPVLQRLGKVYPFSLYRIRYSGHSCHFLYIMDPDNICAVHY